MTVEVFHTLYSYWAATTFGEGPTSEPLADPEADGLANVLEYATGSDPLAVDSGDLPILTVTDGGRIALSFNRVADPALTYRVEASGDGVEWRVIWASTGGVNTAGEVVVKDFVPISTADQRHLRLRVELTE